MNAFTDGVIAILITILVLELRPPEGDRLSDILDEKGHLLAYVLSFVMVAISWVNHHHLMQVVHRIDGRALWANIHLLFWLSLTPVTTAWLGQSGVEAGPVAAYAIVLLGCAIGRDRKGKLSLVLYCVALVFAWIVPWVSVALVVTVAVIWVVPDRRVVRALGLDG